MRRRQRKLLIKVRTEGEITALVTPGSDSFDDAYDILFSLPFSLCINTEILIANLSTFGGYHYKIFLEVSKQTSKHLQGSCGRVAALGHRRQGIRR